MKFFITECIGTKYLNASTSSFRLKRVSVRGRLVTKHMDEHCSPIVTIEIVVKSPVRDTITVAL